jgi:hypothetical protein
MSKKPAKKVNGTKPHPVKEVSFWDNPPPMDEGTREVFNQMAKRIPSPELYGIYPEDIYLVIRYCECQAWLNERPLHGIPDVQEVYFNHGKPRVQVNPELTAWMKINAQAEQLQYRLFKRRHIKVQKQSLPGGTDSESPNDVLRPEDFPKSIREDAVKAAQLTEGKDLSKTMPFALRIGDRIR